MPPSAYVPSMIVGGIVAVVAVVSGVFGPL
jgi:hypothetical protein